MKLDMNKNSNSPTVISQLGERFFYFMNLIYASSDIQMLFFYSQLLAELLWVVGGSSEKV